VHENPNDEPPQVLMLGSEWQDVEMTLSGMQQ
jgi:hypothetical protein